MKNLIKAVEQEYKTRLENFITEINQATNLDTWQYKDLLPRGRKIDSVNKAYLIGRKEKSIYKSI